MIEQKLFFTRNGQYTVWEKINSLQKNELDNVLEFLSTKFQLSFDMLNEVANKKTIIYTTYYSNIKLRSEIDKKIKQYFSNEDIDKCDFNGALFKINLDYTNIDLAYIKLQELKNMNEEYNATNIKTYVYLKKDENCIDVRLTSYKTNQYKNNSNEQIINTEVRIYFKFGLTLMTDYGEYTHSKKIKDMLLNNIYKLLNDIYTDNKVYKLSDITLRILLKKSNRYASKFTFDVDNYMNVDFNIVDDIGDNPLEHSGLREFYDRHPISIIKIAMNSNEDKYITIDGERGKIISRCKSMEIKDINEFVELLNDVVKYDYLNFDYKKVIKDICMRIFIGHTTGKISIMNSIYKEIEEDITKNLSNNEDIDTISITKNTFLYCLINKKLISNNNEENKLSESVVKQLSKMFFIETKKINSTFNYLVSIAISENNNLLEAFDEFINSKGDLNVNQV